MISFKIIDEKNRNDILKELSLNLANEEKEMLEEIISGFDIDADNDIEFGICFYSGCLIIRIFDMGRYLFLFPYAILDNADLHEAIDAVAKYAIREEILLTFTDVPADYLYCFCGFRHMDIDAEDDNAESYRVKIKRESDLIDEIPEIELGRVKLNALCENDISDYSALCKDKNVNKYWGYDYSEDVSEPSDRYFYENAHLEFAAGTSVSFAIRYGDCFVGEAVIYAFDGKGGAEFAIRLLPEYQGIGLGPEGVKATCEAGRRLGLIRIYSKVIKDNLPSLKMLKKVSDECIESDSLVTFTIYLN